ncbi:hypothetical protein ACHAWF_015959 [Thalassiosira exigua]
MCERALRRSSFVQTPTTSSRITLPGFHIFYAPKMIS